MAQPYVGQILAVGFNFAPVGWLLCNGQTLPISQYQVLFALIGTTYGGDGVNTFALPNLCGRVAVNQGQGPGLSAYVLGQNAGTESVTLTTGQVGAHGHPLRASSQTGTTATPSSSVALAQNAQSLVNLYGTVTANTTLQPGSIGVSGGSQSHENRQPALTINYIIAFEGIFPSQN
ncbi:MAG TPA: tail fiber protein [Acetobacteraceae bacterium]|nr:tail fiber protein [Acetobacteraceae bacterium]